MLLSSEQWFIWDCAGIWTEFESFQAAALVATETAQCANSENSDQLTRALTALRELGDGLFCIAIEEGVESSSSGRLVTLVNICSRHRQLDIGRDAP